MRSLLRGLRHRLPPPCRPREAVAAALGEPPLVRVHRLLLGEWLLGRPTTVLPQVHRPEVLRERPPQPPLRPARLSVRPVRVERLPGLVMSQRVLLALTQAGVSREDAYSMVQRNALKVWEDRVDFREQLLADADVVAALGIDEIDAKFDMEYHTKHVDTIFARVFGA